MGGTPTIALESISIDICFYNIFFSNFSVVTMTVCSIAGFVYLSMLVLLSSLNLLCTLSSLDIYWM